MTLVGYFCLLCVERTLQLVSTNTKLLTPLVGCTAGAVLATVVGHAASQKFLTVNVCYDTPDV